MTISKKKKLRKKILNSLKDKAELSTNRGKIEISQFTKPSSKIRRHSGRIYPKIFGSQKELDEEGIFVDWYWDDWENYRDGFRDVTKLEKPNLFWDNEDCKIARARNKKIKKQLAIRKARKEKTKHLNT